MGNYGGQAEKGTIAMALLVFVGCGVLLYSSDILQQAHIGHGFVRQGHKYGATVQSVTGIAGQPPLAVYQSESCKGKSTSDEDWARRVYSPSVQRALQYNQASHNSSYFRSLATALLEAPNTTSKARGPYNCVFEPGQRRTTVAGDEHSIPVYPVSFSLPVSLFHYTVSPKGQDFATVIPGNTSTYKFKTSPSQAPDVILASETAYHADMARSLFAVTYKKFGWDCLRHVEIIAAGALPLMTDIDGLPAGTMAAYPLQVFNQLNKWPGVSVRGLPGTPQGEGGRKEGKYFTGKVACNLTQPLDRDMYLLTVQALLQYGRALLSTSGMARYVMDTVGIKPTDRVLYFGSGKGDYLADTMLHGLHEVMVTPVVDWPRTGGLYMDANSFTEAQLAADKVVRYGNGFSFTFRLHEPFGIDRKNVQKTLDNVTDYYDYIVFAVAHRPAWRMVNVCGKVPRERVIILHGNDPPPHPELLAEMDRCAAHLFVREMPTFCTLGDS